MPVVKRNDPNTKLNAPVANYDGTRLESSRLGTAPSSLWLRSSSGGGGGNSKLMASGLARKGRHSCGMRSNSALCSLLGKPTSSVATKKRVGKYAACCRLEASI